MTGQGLVKYETDHGTVKLSPDIIRKYLVSGDPSVVTHQEVMMFLQLCRFQKLNPFLREAYLIKFKGTPATIVTGKEVFTKRAASAKNCAGWEAGIMVKKGNTVENREGTFLIKGEELLGGWAKVYRKDWNVPMSITVGMDEYRRLKADGTPMANWRTMPATMIRKVALVQALREAFPEDFEGLYTPEEMNIDESVLEDAPIKITEEEEAEDVEDAEFEEEEEEKEPTIDGKQAQKMFAVALGDEKLVRGVMKKYEYEKSSQITLKDYDKIVKEIKKAVKDKEKEEEEKEKKEPEEKQATLSDKELEQMDKDIEYEGDDE